MPLALAAMTRAALVMMMIGAGRIFNDHAS